MGEYNPTRPTVLGQEWVPILPAPYEPDVDVERGHEFTLATPVTLGMGGFYLAAPPEQQFNEQVALMSVYEVGREADIGPIRSIVLPCYHDGNAAYLTGTNNVFGLFQHDAVYSPSDGQYIRIGGSSSVSSGSARFFFDVNHVSNDVDLLQGKRILAVNALLTIYGDVFPVTGSTVITAKLASDTASVEYYQFTSEAVSSAQTRIRRVPLGEVTPWWETTPATTGVVDPTYTAEMYPWRYEEVTRFDNTNARRVSLTISATDVPANASLYIGYVALEVVYCEENRVAVGGKKLGNLDTAVFGETYAQANHVQLRDPATLGYVSLSAGDYLFTVRLASAREGLSLGDRPEVNALTQLYPLAAHRNVEITVPRVVGGSAAVEESDELPQISLHSAELEVTDTFSRVVAGGWGSADTGQAWSTEGGAAANFSVGGATGTIAHPTFTSRAVYLTTAGAEIRDVEAYVEVSMSALATAGDLDAYVMIQRSAMDTARVFAGFSAQTGAQNVRARIRSTVLPPNEVVGVNTGLTHAVPQRYAIRVRYVNHAVYLKVWLATSTEPDQWTAAYVLPDARRPVTTSLGLWTRSQDGATFTFDNLGVRVYEALPDMHVYGEQFAAPVYDHGAGNAEVAQGVIQASGAAAVDYSQARFYARRFGGDSGTLHVLVAGVESASVTSAEFDELPEIVDGWREVTLPLAPAVSVSDAGTALQMEFQPDSGVVPAESRWEILCAAAPVEVSYTGQVATTDPLALDPGTYGDTTAQVTGTSTVTDYNGAMPWRDLAVMLSQQPPDITDLAALPVVQPLTGVGEVCDGTPGCVPTGLYYHEITWSADASLPADHFGAYEVQRRDDIDTDWVTIARISCQDEPRFADFEARVGVESEYRIRVLNSLDFAGDWSAAVASTLPAPGVTGSSQVSSGVLMFTSNERQDGSINLAHVMAWSGRPEETFAFLEAEQVTLHRLYNRDFQVAFRPLERGGESFSRTLLVQNAAIPAPSLGDFRSLRDMAWDTVPYVCVRDELGNRWLATVTVPTGTVRKNRTLYLAQVDITEVTVTPSTVEPECETS